MFDFKKVGGIWGGRPFGAHKTWVLPDSMPREWLEIGSDRFSVVVCYSVLAGRGKDADRQGKPLNLEN